MTIPKKTDGDGAETRRSVKSVGGRNASERTPRSSSVRKAMTIAERVKMLADTARDWYTVGISLEGRIFVTPKSGPRVSRWLTESSDEIAADLALYLRRRTGEEFSSKERKEALLSLSDEARTARRVRTSSRIANPRPGVIAVDMCNDAGECYVITKDGWTVTTDPGDDVVFIRGENAQALPSAVRGGDIGRIWEIANVPEESRPLIVCNWHTAMQRGADHPIISLVGQAGSAKTSLSAILSYLLDPIEGEGFDSMPIALPEDPAEIYAVASSQYFIPFDNVDGMTKQQQTAMSVIATGGVYARRELYTTARVYRAPVRGCLILASIDLGKVKPDFMDRVITVEIEPIPGGVFRDRAEVKAAFDAMHGEVLGGLFDQAVSVLGVYDQVQKNMQQQKIRTSRLSTFSYTLASLDSLCGTSAFPQFMQEQASRQAESATDDVLIATVIAVIDEQGGQSRAYTPTELLAEVNKKYKESEPFSKLPMGWPANAAHFTKQIKVMEIPLDRAGYAATYKKSNGARKWVLVRKPVQETVPTSATVVPINRGAHAQHTAVPSLPEQIAPERAATVDMPTVGVMTYHCDKQGDHAQCQRNRARKAPLALGCPCPCHTAPTSGPTAPTSGPTAPTAPTSGPTAPTSGPTAPTAPTSGPDSRKQNNGNGFRGDSAVPPSSKRQAGKFTTETAAYVDVAAGKGVTSDDRTFTYRKTKSGPTLARLLGSIPEGVRHVHITGIVPGETPEGFRTWAQGELPEGWQVGDRGTMFDARHPDRATLHYVRPEGDPLTVYRAAGWVGIDLEETTSAAELRESFDLLRAGLRATFTLATRDDHGVPIKATPGATGIELARRTLPAGKTYPILSDADQKVLRSYAGQGRGEDYSLPTHPTGGVNMPDTIPGLYIADMRWAYAKALEMELPIGELSKDTESTFLFRDDIERTGFLPCWYRVRVTVPSDWNRHGLFGFRDETRNGQWTYPSEPGTTFETWAWDRSLILGEKHGWMIGDHVQILERWKFDATRRNEKPLVTFGKHIRTLRQEWLPEQSASRTVKALVSAMARNICIAAIGSMLGKHFESYRSESDLSKVAELPVTALLSEDGKRYEWFEAGSAAGTLSHPEWISYIYAATRDRLFDHPTQKGIGIAHVDKSVLLAVHTDSLWTTEPIGVEDTGKVGDFRPQTAHDGELPTPRTYAELMSLRNELDQAGE